MDSLGRKKVLDGYDCINLDGLKEEISRFLGLECCFIMDTQKRPFGGSECVIVVLEDTEGSKWAVRFLLQFQRFPRHIELVVEREAALRLAIEKNAITGIPKLKTFSATFNNLARFPYIAVEWAEGTQLQWTETWPNVPQRDKVIQSVAHTVISLLKIQNKSSNFFLSLKVR